MTQVADSPRAHRLKASGHAIPERLQQGDVLVHGLSMFAGEPSVLPLGAVEHEAQAPAVQEPDLLEYEATEGGEELLMAVWRTSSYLEGVQWELDAAQSSLFRAVRDAARSGVEHGELCKAANMTPGELAAALQEPADPPVL